MEGQMDLNFVIPFAILAVFGALMVLQIFLTR